MLRRFLNAIGFGSGVSLPKGRPVTIDGSSQIDVLNFRMSHQGFTHDQTALVDLENVKVRDEEGDVVMYFCDMRPIVVREQISVGDGKPVPHGLKLEKVRIPKELLKERGKMFNVRKVKLHSNGTMQIIATAGTIFELAD